MRFSGATTGPWLRNQLFRLWTAAAVLAFYAYAWVEKPELLTWWKRTTNRLIERGCDLLPYPWGDRVEATVGNFGLWVQITLAIVMVRMVVTCVLALLRWSRKRPSASSRSASRTRSDA